MSATSSFATLIAKNGHASETEVETKPNNKALRKRYSREEKLRILRLVDACNERGQVGAILRREGLYYTTLQDFRKQRAQGRLDDTHGNTKQANKEQANELARLRRQNARLQQKLAQADLIIEVQKKVSQLLGLTMQTDEEENALS